MRLSSNFRVVRHHGRSSVGMFSFRMPSRRIHTSITSTPDRETFRKVALEVKRVVTKDCYLNLTDFGSPGGPRDVIEQLKFCLSLEDLDMSTCTVILSVANSGDQWRERLELMQSLCGTHNRPRSIMLVWGSQGPALTLDPEVFAMLQWRYKQMCKWVVRNGFDLTLVGDVTGHSGPVLADFGRKLALGATTINTHPLVDPSLMTMESRAGIAALLKQYGAQIIFGQLSHTATLYEQYHRAEGEERVDRTSGRDLYPASQFLRDCARNGGWQAATQLGLAATNSALRQVAPTQVLTKSLQSRVGMRVTTEDLKAMHEFAMILSCEQTDVTEATLRMLAKYAKTPMSASALSSLARRYTGGLRDDELKDATRNFS